MVSDRVPTVQSKLSFAAPVRQGTKSNPVVIDVEDSDEGEQDAIDLESEESEGPDYLEGTTEAESSDEDQQDGMDPAEPERREIARHVELLYKGELVRLLYSFALQLAGMSDNTFSCCRNCVDVRETTL